MVHLEYATASHFFNSNYTHAEESPQRTFSLFHLDHHTVILLTNHPYSRTRIISPQIRNDLPPHKLQHGGIAAQLQHQPPHIRERRLMQPANERGQLNLGIDGCRARKARVEVVHEISGGFLHINFQLCGDVVDDLAFGLGEVEECLDACCGVVEHAGDHAAKLAEMGGVDCYYLNVADWVLTEDAPSLPTDIVDLFFKR